MNIAIIGAGAMGCFYGAMLSKEHTVTLYDNNENVVNAINENGIWVKDATSNTHYDVSCKLSGKGDKCAELVILFVKSTVSDIALKSNINLIEENTVVLSLQNGMGNYEIISKYVKENNILLGTSKHNSVLEDFGVVFHSGNGETVLGSKIHNDVVLDKIYNAFVRSKIVTHKSNNVTHLLWKKLFVNLTLNPVTALFDQTINLICENEEAKRIVKNLLVEAVEVANADGENFDFQTVLKEVSATAVVLRTGYTSMCQDIKNNRKTEISFINGSIVRIGQKYGIKTPYNEMILNLIKIKETVKNGEQ